MRKHIFAGFFFAVLLVALCGCSLCESKTKKIRDVEYTVVTESELPAPLLEKINAQKEDMIRLTYLEDEYLYIVKGYGKQETGGCSISVKELYLTENAVYFSTEFHGPKKGEAVTDAPSFPYITIKLERLDVPVVFE